ncbi:MAG: hypothetical protein ACYCVU_10695, partial [Gammaproteobacteria bacterium]
GSGGWAEAGQVAVLSTVGGTASALSGGSFENGAVSTAFQVMFNDLAHGIAEQMRENEKMIAAEIYGEKGDVTTAGAEAMASVILNRARSGQAQYVNPGEPVTVLNVLNKTRAFQAMHSSSYNSFGKLGGPPQIEVNKIMNGINDVIDHGPTTNATFFIANRHGAPPWRQELRALGIVIPADTPVIDGIYFYVPKPP